MKRVFLDANVVLNVWRKEIDPASHKDLYSGSMRILEKIALGSVRGSFLSTTAMEILHAIRVEAEAAHVSPGPVLKKAEARLSAIGCQIVVPDFQIMGAAYELLFDLHLDPHDCYLVAAAKEEKADAVISRDAKLKKKASKLVPVFTPEEFLRGGTGTEKGLENN